MRKAKYSVPIWPYIGAVACLFVLTLLAPITWRNVTTLRPANRAAVPRVQLASPPPQHLPKSANLVPTGQSALASEPKPSSLIGVFPPPSRVRHAPPATATAVSPVQAFHGNLGPAPVELSGFAAPRQHAVAAPPVADRIQVPVKVPDQPRVTPPTTSHAFTLPKRVVAVSSSSVADSPAPRERTVAFPKTPLSWPRAAALIDQFRVLQRLDETRAWATGAIATLDAIDRQNSLAAPEMSTLLNDLSNVAKQGIVLARTAPTPELRRKITRAGYATVRRELIWRQVHQIATSDAPPHRNISNQAAQVRLAKVQARIARSANGEAWREYLRLDAIHDYLRNASMDMRATLAHDVLTRMTSPKLTSKQRTILQAPPFSDLEAELRRWVIQPIAYPQLLNDIEQYEQSPSAAVAHRIANAYQAIRWSPDAGIAELAERLDKHYRNANIRVAVRDDLLNRLLPQQEVFEEEVNEEIIGAQVLGNAQASAHMRTVLIPDPQRWRFGLEVEGEVESRTAATRGPATFFNDGYSRYQARTLFQIDRRGIVVSDAEAEANMNSELTGFRTLFDSLPVIGWVARGIARQQHDDQTEMAQWVSETRLETRMRERLDSEVQTQLEEAQAKIERKIVTPLEKLDLRPNAVEMRTTKDRLIARYRLAADDHLGAFTPRPQAPSDSMLSVQVHETMLNNTLEQLALDGRRTKLRQLYRDLADAFDRSDLQVPDDIPENITLQFAKTDPVRVHCEDGKLTLSIQIAELKNRRNAWENFEVRAEYIPDSTDLRANLVRDGVVRLIGKRLSFGDQIVLRTIFSRTLSKNQPFNVINSKLAKNPAIADLNVNQFVIEDGWIGVALGPHRVASRVVPAPVVNAPARSVPRPAPVVDAPARMAPSRVATRPAPVVNAVR